LSSLQIIKSHIFRDKFPLLQTNPGIGDMLNCYIYASELFDRYEKIKIKVDYNVLFSLRNQNQYSEKLHGFTKKLSEIIFQDNRFELVDDCLPTGCISTHDYPFLLGVEFKPKDLSFILNNTNYIPIKDNYIVLNTKIREYDRSLNDKNIKYLIEHLNNYNGKIVLMGDRIVDHSRNIEYRSYQNLVYSIYEQIINQLDKNKVIDLTENFLMHEPNIEKFLKEYNLVKRANSVIQIGFSGSYLLSMALNTNTKVVCHNDNFIWMAKMYLQTQNIKKTYAEL
jgi:hypothetical protein